MDTFNVFCFGVVGLVLPIIALIRAFTLAERVDRLNATVEALRRELADAKGRLSELSSRVSGQLQAAQPTLNVPYRAPPPAQTPLLPGATEQTPVPDSTTETLQPTHAAADAPPSESVVAATIPRVDFGHAAPTSAPSSTTASVPPAPPADRPSASPTAAAPLDVGTVTSQSSTPPATAAASPEPTEQPRLPEFADRAPPPASRAAPAGHARPEPTASLEEQIGITWFTRIGAAILLLGTAYFFKYAVDNNWIGPWGRIGLAALAGVGLLGAAERMRATARSQYVQALLGLGVAVLYLAGYALHGFYRLVSVAVSFALLAVVASVGGALSVRHRSQPILVMSLLAAFANPILLSTGTDRPLILFSYLLLVTSGALAVSVPLRFYAAPILALAGTALLCVGWAARYFTPPTTYGSLVSRTVPITAAILLSAQWAGFGSMVRRREWSVAGVRAALLVGPLVWVAASGALLLDHPIALALVLAAGILWSERLLAGGDDIVWLALPATMSGWVLLNADIPAPSHAAALVAAHAAWLAAHAFVFGRRYSRSRRDDPFPAAIVLTAAVGVFGVALYYRDLANAHPVGLAACLVVVSACLVGLGSWSRARWVVVVAMLASGAGLALASKSDGTRSAPFLVMCAAWGVTYFAESAVALLGEEPRASGASTALITILGGAIGFLGAVLLNTPASSWMGRAVSAAIVSVPLFVVGVLLARRRPAAVESVNILLAAALACVQIFSLLFAEHASTLLAGGLLVTGLGMVFVGRLSERFWVIALSMGTSAVALLGAVHFGRAPDALCFVLIAAWALVYFLDGAVRLLGAPELRLPPPLITAVAPPVVWLCAVVLGSYSNAWLGCALSGAAAAIPLLVLGTALGRRSEPATRSSDLLLVSALLTVQVFSWELLGHATALLASVLVVLAVLWVIAGRLSRRRWIVSMALATSAAALVLTASRSPQHSTLLLTLCALWAIVHVIDSAASLLRSQERAPPVELLAIVVGPATFLAALIVNTGGHDGLLRAMGAAGASAPFFVLAPMLARGSQRSREDSNALFGFAIGFVVVGIAFAVSGATITLLWALVAAVVAHIAARSGDRDWMFGAIALFALIVVRALAFDFMVPINDRELFERSFGSAGSLYPVPFRNARALGLLAVAIACFVAGVAFRNGAAENRRPQLARTFGSVGHLFLLAWCILEVRGALVIRPPPLETAVRPEAFGAYMADVDRRFLAGANRLDVAATLVMGVYGAALVAAGFLARSVSHRWLGLLVLAATIAKLAAWDIWNLPRPLQVLVLMCIGALLLGAGFLYARFGKRLLGLLRNDLPK